MNKEDLIKLKERIKNEEKEKERFVNPNDRKYNYLLNNNLNYMNYTALSFGKRRISYEELHECINKYAKILFSKGIRQGDVIGICALNTPESIYLLYALDLIGAVVVGFNPFDNKDKIRKDIEITKPKMIITVDMNYSNFKEFEKALNFSTILYSPIMSVDDKKIKIGYNIKQILDGNYKLSKKSYLSSMIKNNDDIQYIEKAKYIENEVTDIMFTGGSTGVHKGVDLYGSGLNYVVDGMNSLFTPYPGMVHLGEIPVGSMSYGKMLMHYALCNNMEFALTLKAMPEDFYDELVRTKAEAAAGGPPHWVSLIEKSGDSFIPSSKITPGSLSNLKFATSGGEAIKSNTYYAIMDAFKKGNSQAILGDGLGATETWGTIIVNNGTDINPNTIGKKISTINVNIINPKTGLKVEKGEKGLLFVSGPSIMKGYHNNAKENEKVFKEIDGQRWLNLGDYLIESEDGSFKYVGRQKRNFVSNVENIYPEQLEDFLTKLPEIREVIVTPISDEIRQFIPKLHISLYNENENIDALENKIKNLILKKFGINWIPGYYEYYYEPLKRMMNTKLDFGYYQSKDQEEIKLNNKKLELTRKNH